MRLTTIGGIIKFGGRKRTEHVTLSVSQPSTFMSSSSSTTFHLGSQPRLCSIEYPGPVSSVTKALESVGGIDKVSQSLTHHDANDNDDEREAQQQQQQQGASAGSSAPINKSYIELDFNKHDAFSHKIKSSTNSTGNIVIKLVKRKRKHSITDDKGQLVHSGVYTMQVAGVTTRSIRFRGQRARNTLLIVQPVH